MKDNLYVSLTSKEIIAALRARALVHDKVTTRLRFFSASETLDDWSVLDLAPVYRALRDALKAGVDDPAAWLDRNYDIFAQQAHDTPEYVAFVASRDGAKAKLVGSTRTAPSFSAVLDEIYAPANEQQRRNRHGHPDIDCVDVDCPSRLIYGTPLIPNYCCTADGCYNWNSARGWRDAALYTPLLVGAAHALLGLYFGL